MIASIVLGIVMHAQMTVPWIGGAVTTPPAPAYTPWILDTNSPLVLDTNTPLVIAY